MCCPAGCPAGNRWAPAFRGPQLLAFNVAADVDDARDLSGSREAQDLAARLPGDYGTACAETQAVP